MTKQNIFDMTKMMERLIDESMAEVNILRALLTAAEGAHQTSHCNLFRIGAQTYSLKDLEKIQETEEHEALVNRHKTNR